mmetsp:Transcript_64873/g.152534  ORF Transcript_64873/g.152534 Transcript_64873/m.152534 type:complete len:549 (+) Transcript_64873:44-1690(+)
MQDDQSSNAVVEDVYRCVTDMGNKVCCELAGGSRDPVEAPLVHHRPVPAWTPSPDHGAYPAYQLPASPAGAFQVRAPPAHWGGMMQQAVTLRQKEGHPQVRIFAAPAPGAKLLGAAPSNSQGVEVAACGDFVQVHVGAMCGWVGAKNVIRSPAAPPAPPAPPWQERPASPSAARPAGLKGASPPTPSSASSNPPWSSQVVSPPSPPPPAPPPLPGAACSSLNSTSSASQGPSVQPAFTSPGLGRLPGPDYSWIRKANGPNERQLRRAAAEETLAVCDAGGYVLDGRLIKLTSIASACAQTRLVAAAQPTAGGPARARWQRHGPGLLLDVACKLAKTARPVAVVNAASAYHAGGGFLTGGRHALEESLCMRSTLFATLRKAEALARSQKVPPSRHCKPATQSGAPWICHIPETGCIASPDVEVFRGGSDDGYPVLPQVSKLAVISVAMPNRNTQVRDAPIDAPDDPGLYRTLLLQKFAAVLSTTAALLGPDGIFVVPDVGCGAYGNDPSEVGTLLGEALRQQPGLFAEIHLVGQERFSEAAERTAKGRC